MRFNKVSILSVAYADAPERVLTEKLERRLSGTLKRLGIPENFLERVTGVRARRFWEDGVKPSEAATRAGALAIAQSDIDPQTLDVLINTSVSRDYMEPSVACFVHNNLKLGTHCASFDVANACVGFLTGIQIAGSMIEQGHIRYAMIVDGEGARYAIDKTIAGLLRPETNMEQFKESFATLTLGSGAAAMILADATLTDKGHRVVGSFDLAATEYNQLCLGDAGSMRTDAAGLMTAGMQLARKAYPRFLEKFGYATEDLDHCIIHQVSRPHTDAVIRTLGWDNNKVYRLFPEFGNMGPAGMPTALAKSEQEGNIKIGDTVALMGIGSGLNCTVIPIEW